MKRNKRVRRVVVSADGKGVVSHAGIVEHRRTSGGPASWSGAFVSELGMA